MSFFEKRNLQTLICDRGHVWNVCGSRLNEPKNLVTPAGRLPQKVSGIYMNRVRLHRDRIKSTYETCQQTSDTGLLKLWYVCASAFPLTEHTYTHTRTHARRQPVSAATFSNLLTDHNFWGCKNECLTLQQTFSPLLSVESPKSA